MFLLNNLKLKGLEIKENQEVTEKPGFTSLRNNTKTIDYKSI